jgi:hypothetical protein
VNKTGLAVMSSMLLDVVVTNNNVTTSFNDTRNLQANDSKYYAVATCKPFTVINKGTPTVDGASDSAWDVAPVVPFTINKNDGGTLTASASAKLLWDESYLYILATVVDDELDKSGTSGGAHLQDSVEVFLDENNHKSGTYESDDVQYRINFDNAATFNPETWSANNLKSAVTKTDTGYVVEAAIKWTQITPKNGTYIGLEMQINDTAAGTRLGTSSWFDYSGNGWSAPEVFGTALLSDPSAQSDTWTDNFGEDMNETPQTFLPRGADNQPNHHGMVAVYDEITLSDGSKVSIDLKSISAAFKQAARDFAKSVTTSEPFAFVDVIANGYKGGPITIKFNLYDIYANDQIVVFHYKPDGTWETIIPDKIEDGAVTVTFTSLSPVVFSKLSTSTPQGSSQSPKTYDSGVKPIVVVFFVGFLCIGISSLVWARRKSGK